MIVSQRSSWFNCAIDIDAVSQISVRKSWRQSRRLGVDGVGRTNLYALNSTHHSYSMSNVMYSRSRVSAWILFTPWFRGDSWLTVSHDLSYGHQSARIATVTEQSTDLEQSFASIINRLTSHDQYQSPNALLYVQRTNLVKACMWGRGQHLKLKV